jgi:long-chain acyl-CoA synthetase
MLLKLPVIDQKIRNKILTTLNHVFGNDFYEIVVGGAAFNHEAENFFKQIGFRYTVGYGMTECGPLISYEDWSKAPLYSCGKAILGMEIKIDSPDPENVAGEVLVKGDNVMLGYYRNEQATKDAFTPDGWMKTGDLAIMDKNGYVFIKGRSKSMILGSSGQNIYPEELEDVINNMPYVSESLVVDQGGKLVALIYPDYEQTTAAGIADTEIPRTMEGIRAKINEELPHYAQIAQVKIFPEEFEKTPKRSIKRFLYQNV